ncbi:MFS transporter [Dongia mobilis]|uniref:MFS transporter n=1 Tax=Dongia mobilis TaxID=578943 RepID=UPI001FB72636|nr:MFS transporter [Dongia mobilis]
MALAMLLASLGTSIANIALPSLTLAFGAPFIEVQGVVVAYLAALTVAVVIAGRLGDRYGLRRMLLLGLGLFAAASLLCGFANDLSLLIGARALQGVGAAFLMTLPLALMRAHAGQGRIGRAMGMLGSVSALGTALGPSLGGLLLPFFGWRGIFLVQVPLALLALSLVFLLLPRESGEATAKSPESGTHAPSGAPIWANLVANLLVAAVMMTTLVVGPFYLDFGLGLSALLVGLVLSLGPVVSILGGIPSGRLVDHWGAGRVVMLGLVLLAAGAFLLAMLPGALGLGGYVLGILVLTPGYQLFQAANNTLALAGVSAARRGAVSGLLGLARNIGLIAGASLMGAVFALGTGTAIGSGDFTHTAPDAIATGLNLTFLLAGGMMLAAIAIAGGRLTMSPAATARI